MRNLFKYTDGRIEKTIKVGGTVNTIWGSYYEVISLDRGVVLAQALNPATGKPMGKETELRAEDIQVDMYTGATSSVLERDDSGQATMRLILEV